MTTDIQVYANKGFSYTQETGTTNIVLQDIDPSQVLNEFTVDERLESLELSDVADYLAKKEAEAMEDSEYELDDSEWRESFNGLTVRG